ncbi:MAG: hypothetical protein LBK55_00775 [Azoarcus sp.]|jgi:hypothetical protein|nr:hypothetical protein [Azoarcus sp.]
MKFGVSDLPRLRASLLAMALMAVLGAAAAVYSHGRIAEARSALAAAQAERNEIGGKLRQVRSEENEIRQKAAVFDRLAARGVIGEEARLEWVELLNEIRDRRRLPEIHYEFAPRRALNEAQAQPQAGSFGLYASAMKLQARLLHEEDLLRLLGDLRERAPALIQVKRCDLSRLLAADAGNPLQGLLQVDCLIDWITLRAAGSGAENAQ